MAPHPPAAPAPPARRAPVQSGLARRLRASMSLLAGAGAVSGCAAGAPSLPLFGAYFPVWLLCLLFGVAIAIVARVLLVATGLAAAVPLQLLVCVCAGMIGGIMLSWLWLGI